MQVLLATCGAWYLPHTAKAFQERNALAGLWISGKNQTALPDEKFRRCWPFHLAMKPFYQFAPQILIEHAFYAMIPFWKNWIRAQTFPEFNVVQGIAGYCTELFDVAEKSGALKVIDCANSHPTTYHGYWQRECDLWCPGEKVPIPRWFLGRMNRELERADLILCPSNFVRDTMVLNGIPTSKCFVNPFGADTSIFQPRKAVPAKPRFISVGTICVRKGHQYLFRAFEQVKKAIPEAELICVGDYKTDFRFEKERWEKSFTHYPKLNHSELAELLASCSAFVFPSLEEGFARVLSEAMAAGLPIIASYESGATTLVRDGVEGIIVEPRNPQDIARAILTLAQDRSLNQNMSQAAYEKGAVKNTWMDYGERLLLEYQARLEQSVSRSTGNF
jgi:glycosyltransferase involved in cell wall biosynthesis